MEKSLSLIMLVVLFTGNMAWAERAGKWYEKGISAMEVGFYNVAIECFEKAIAIDPNDSRSHLKMGIVYSKKGKKKEAISYFKKTIAINPELAKAHYHLGVIYAEEGKLKGAISELRKVVAINPDDREAHQKLGVAYDKKGMFNEAISEYKKTLSMNSNMPIINYNLGVVYYKKGLNALSADYLHKSGLLFLRRGDRDSAIKAYEALKKTKSKEFEKSLFEKLYPELKKGSGDFITTPPERR